ncbi:MAG: hypothetical protein IJF84_03675 [Thermoguttaceae bacterium]|nr:hypothetical protein [Thermoguttaceae bacterium]
MNFFDMECDGLPSHSYLTAMPSRPFDFLYQAALDGLSDSINNKSESSADAFLSHSEKCHN